jgi:magnesium-transporting ATPase (P-type)
MFTFKKEQLPKVILINSSRILTGSELTVDSVWQSSPDEDLMVVLSKAINESDDPLDAALHHYLQVNSVVLPPHLPLYDAGFDRRSGISSTIWHYGADYQLVAKGMPEHILEKCDLSENEREALIIRMHSMSAFGAHIVAVATVTVKHPIKNLGDLRVNEKLTFVGFVSLQRTVSDEARQLITSASHRGMTVYLTTGQHPAAAYSLAQRLGIASQLYQVVDARTFDVATDDSRAATLKTARVFARATAEHKQHIGDILLAIDPRMATVNSLDDLRQLLAKKRRTVL